MPARHVGSTARYAASAGSQAAIRHLLVPTQLREAIAASSTQLRTASHRSLRGSSKGRAALAWTLVRLITVFCLPSQRSARNAAPTEGIVPCRSQLVVICCWTPAAGAAEPQLLAELVRHGRLVCAWVAGPCSSSTPASVAATTAAPEGSAAAPATAATAPHALQEACRSAEPMKASAKLCNGGVRTRGLSAAGDGLGTPALRPSSAPVVVSC